VGISAFIKEVARPQFAICSPYRLGVCWHCRIQRSWILVCRTFDMDFDLPGRIKNTKLPFSGALLPVFEAVVNSIHAVAEAPHPENGLIRVHLERDLTQQSFPSEVVGVVLGPVRSVTIRDNGIGFTDVHYRSFSTADTRQKANIDYVPGGR
jgi:hypothetical protein